MNFERNQNVTLLLFASHFMRFARRRMSNAYYFILANFIIIIFIYAYQANANI
jgi:hypothetical protein